MSSHGNNRKLRLDVLLVERGLAESQKHAQGLILSGAVLSDTKHLDKPGAQVRADIPLEIRNKKEHPWVSRGGMKLAHGLEYFALDVAGRTALDVGASTGGFTDVLLSCGVAKVFAVDVGYGELAWKLQQDARVVVLDRLNARHLTAEHIPQKVGIIVCDASFISLKSILPVPLGFAEEGAMLVALIKPQFEVRRGEVGQGGIITDPVLHARVCDEIKEWLEAQDGWDILGITESPITGKEGNKEFLIAARYSGHSG